MPAKKGTRPSKKTSGKLHKPKEPGKPRLFTLDVFVISGPITEKLQNLYFDVVHGRNGGHPEWLTLVK